MDGNPLNFFIFRELQDELHEKQFSHLRPIKSADLDSMGWSAAHYAERW